VDIKGFALIESVADIPAYEEKRLIVQKGLEQVATLEDRCETDWEEAQGRLRTTEKETIAIVERAFDEMRYRTQERYEQSKKDLQLQRSHFEELLRDRDFLLSPEEVTLLNATLTQPLFSIAVRNIAVPIAELLLAHFQLVPPVKKMGIAPLASAQTEKGEVHMAEQTATFADASYSESRTLHFKAAVTDGAIATKQLTQLLPNSSPQHIAEKQAGRRLKAGRKAVAAGNYDRALKKLTAARALLEGWEQESAKLCLELGVVLSYFGKWREAETELKRGLALELQSHPASELVLQLRNTLAESYFQESRVEDIITLCEETLLYWSHSPYSSELLRALYYLALALYRNSKKTQGFAKVNEWTGKITVQTPLSQCFLQFILASKLQEEGRLEEAAQMFEKALKRAQHLIPQSFLTASSKYYLASAYHDLKQEQRVNKPLKQACELLSRHFPQSLLAAVCHSSIATLYLCRRQFDLAEIEFVQASQVLATHFAQGLNYADTLARMGVLLQSKGHRDEAIEKWKAALALYKGRDHTKEVQVCEKALKRLRSEATFA